MFQHDSRQKWSIAIFADYSALQIYKQHCSIGDSATLVPVVYDKVESSLRIGTMLPIPITTLTSLAPESLVSRCATRYLGDDISVPLNTLVLPDQQIAAELYAVLQDIYALMRGQLDTPTNPIELIQAFLQRVDWLALIRKVQQFGRLTQAVTEEPHEISLLSKVLHDIRGGSFQALSIQLQFINIGLAKEYDWQRIVFLARDHLKIMRNALPGIDAAGHEHDSTAKLHSVQLLIEKWQQTTYSLQDHSAVVSVESHFDGSVSERCLEFAALDRVLYNLLNNAVRNTADGRAYLAILPQPMAGPHDLRFVVINAISPAQREMLYTRYGEDLGELFQGGFTTGGTGLGMRICGDFVTNAYGVASIDEGVSGGYIGAKLVDSHFLAWFHWPIAAH